MASQIDAATFNSGRPYHLSCASGDCDAPDYREIKVSRGVACAGCNDPIRGSRAPIHCTAGRRCGDCDACQEEDHNAEMLAAEVRADSWEDCEDY